MHDEFATISISDLAVRYRRGETSPLEATRYFLERIRTVDPTIGAFISVNQEAEAQALILETELRQRRDRGPLHGVPIAVKDNIAVAGLANTAGSRILADNVPGQDAPCIVRLREAGAVILGKTNLHEFACGGTTQNPFYGGTRNPWHTGHIPGGSSGGSAAAVAAGEAIAAIGTDTGSSIRLPAAMCGVVGLKPTYGLVSISGVVPLAWSCDHVGPLTRTVTDTALLLNALAGFDSTDAGSLELSPEDFTREIERGLDGLRIGYVLHDGRGPIERAIQQNLQAALDAFQSLGAHVVETTLPGLDEAVDIQHIIVLGEMGETHSAWFPERAADYGEDVRRFLAQAQELSAITYIEALHRRRALQVAFRSSFAPFDAIITPAGPLTAPPIGQVRLAIDGVEIEIPRHLTRFFAAFNLTGQPAIVVPTGLSPAGLPTGLQIVANHGQDALALRIARAYEREARVQTE